MYSGNIVGYTKLNLAAGKMDMKGMQFIKVVDATPLNIQSIEPVLGFNDEGGDTIRFWSPSTLKYTTATYYLESYDDQGEEELGPGWVDDYLTRLTNSVPAGKGFWFETLNNASYIVAAQVIEAEDNTIVLVGGKMDIVCNPFPAEILIQDIKPVSGFNDEGGDTIRFWNPSTLKYTTATYYLESYDDQGEEELGPGWVDDYLTRLTNSIPVGNSFWFETLANAVYECTPPAALTEETP